MKTAVLEQELTMLRTSEASFLKNNSETKLNGCLDWLPADIYEKTVSWMF